MPLREALRRLRHLARKGGDTLADIVPTDALPESAAKLATAMLRDARQLAQGLDAATSGLVKQVLGRGQAGAMNLSDVGGSGNDGADFASAVYIALRSVLGHLGAPDLFISEAVARNVHAHVLRNAGDRPSALAANLTLDLLSAHVMRGATAEQAARVPGASLEQVAVFAVLLWLQSSRSDNENEAALEAATDLAVAISADVAAACATGDRARLATLYERYAPHV